MELIKLKNNNLTQLNIDLSKIVATIGEFDGVHLAHQKLILKTISIAQERKLKSALITFDPHPDYVIKSRRYEGYLSKLEEKATILENYSIDYLIVISFTKELMNSSKDEFFNNYLSKFNYLVVGYDFKFGYQGSGDAKYLSDKLGSNSLCIVDEVKYDGIHKISSNAIRTYLKEGRIEDANKLLGYPYWFYGKVTKGKGIGTTLGFPTANVVIDDEKFIPKCGVYRSFVIYNNLKYKGILNIGYNPSINPLTKPRLEVHILDFNENIYGRFIKIEIYHFIREEIKFSTKEELIYQIKKDQEDCMRNF